jgi:hypothetical protein
MSQLARKLQKIFGGLLAANGNIAEFGSLKAGVVGYSLDPDDIQTAAYLNGWADAVINNDAPPLEDMNALFYLLSYQLAYIFQAGIPEWDATTTYYPGSVVMDTSAGATGTQVYLAITNASPNLNQKPHDAPTYWIPFIQNGTKDLTGPTVTVDAQIAMSFNVAAGAGGNKALTVSNMIDGQTIVIYVGGAVGNTVTFTIAGLTQKTGGTYSNTMTNGASMFTLTRVGTYVVINSLHGLS